MQILVGKDRAFTFDYVVSPQEKQVCLSEITDLPAIMIYILIHPLVISIISALSLGAQTNLRCLLNFRRVSTISVLMHWLLAALKDTMLQYLHTDKR